MSASHDKSHPATKSHSTPHKSSPGAETAHDRSAAAGPRAQVGKETHQPSPGSAPTLPDQMLLASGHLEDAEAAAKRVEHEALALTQDELSAQNVDIVAATSIILGVAPRVLSYRGRMKALPEFDMRNVDELVDRAKASWFVAITNLPAPEPKDFQSMLDEATALRQHLLTWAAPLVSSQKFEQAALDQIKEGSGNKDTASDVVSLVTLYRSKWHEVRGMCGVTEAELERGAVLGPALFSAVSLRENKALPSTSDGTLRVRRFWTLADRYVQSVPARDYLFRMGPRRRCDHRAEPSPQWRAAHDLARRTAARHDGARGAAGDTGDKRRAGAGRDAAARG